MWPPVTSESNVCFLLLQSVLMLSFNERRHSLDPHWGAVLSCSATHLSHVPKRTPANCLRALSPWGIQALLKDTSAVIMREELVLYILPSRFIRLVSGLNQRHSGVSASFFIICISLWKLLCVFCTSGFCVIVPHLMKSMNIMENGIAHLLHKHEISSLHIKIQYLC